MKIAVVGYFGWYGSISEWVSRGWQRNGHVVDNIDRKNLPNIESWDAYQVVVCVDCSEDYSQYLPGAEEKGPIWVFWSLDAHMPGGIERSTNIAKKCHLTFSGNYEHGVKILEKFGITSFLLPVTFDNTLMSEVYPSPATADILMIGNPNSPQRLELWDRLKKRFGEEYKVVTGRVDKQEDYVGYYATARVIVNQPTEPWDGIINNRFWEGLAAEAIFYREGRRGCMLFQKRLATPIIEKFGFKDGRDFQYWDTFDDLMDSIDSYLCGRKVKGQRVGAYTTLWERYSMSAQCLKMEAVIFNHLYDHL